jgi:hypothetical protein
MAQVMMELLLCWRDASRLDITITKASIFLDTLSKPYHDQSGDEKPTGLESLVTFSNEVTQGIPLSGNSSNMQVYGTTGTAPTCMTGSIDVLAVVTFGKTSASMNFRLHSSSLVEISMLFLESYYT